MVAAFLTGSMSLVKDVVEHLELEKIRTALLNAVIFTNLEVVKLIFDHYLSAETDPYNITSLLHYVKSIISPNVSEDIKVWLDEQLSHYRLLSRQVIPPTRNLGIAFRHCYVSDLAQVLVPNHIR